MVQGIYQRGSLYSTEATTPSVTTCTCLALLLSSTDGCELHMAMPGVEDDYAAAEIAVETNAFGIISDDSDFLCFQVIAILCSIYSYLNRIPDNCLFQADAISIIIRYRLAFTDGWREGILRTRRRHTRGPRIRYRRLGPLPWYIFRPKERWTRLRPLRFGPLWLGPL